MKKETEILVDFCEEGQKHWWFWSVLLKVV